MIEPSLPAVSAVLGSVVVCLAQAEADRPEALVLQYLPLVVIAAAAYLLLFRPERERAKKQQELLAGLKKNDRVVTASGIYGTVAAVDREADRVTLKIDEATNTKLTVTLSSVAKVLRDGSGESGTADSG